MSSSPRETRVLSRKHARANKNQNNIIHIVHAGPWTVSRPARSSSSTSMDELRENGKTIRCDTCSIRNLILSGAHRKDVLVADTVYIIDKKGKTNIFSSTNLDWILHVSVY